MTLAATAPVVTNATAAWVVLAADRPRLSNVPAPRPTRFLLWPNGRIDQLGGDR